MSTSLVMYMIVDSITTYLNLDNASDFYTGLPTSSCQGVDFIGGFNNFGKDYVLERTLQLPTHRKIKITAQILLEDSWDWEIFYFYVDGVLAKTLTKGPYDGTYMCGHGYYPEMWFDLSWEGDHEKPNITLKINSTLDEVPYTESWGFKNFKMYYVAECFKFYTECNYLGTEYVFCPRTPLESQEEFILPIKSIKVPAGRILYLQDPNFHGGVKQQYTSDQACIDPFTFPKQLVVP